MTIVTAITHRITGGILLMASPHFVSMQPVVAKNPGVMASNGGHSTAEIRFDGSSTVYITATNPTGATIKLHRVE